MLNNLFGPFRSMSLPSIVLLLIASCSTLPKNHLKSPEVAYHEGIMVEAVDTDNPIFEHQPAKRFIPASTLKLASAFAAKKLLKDSLIAFKLIKNERQHIVIPTGNPTLLYADFQDSLLIDYLNQNPDGFISFPPQDFEPFASGWSWEDYPYSFSAERSVLPIYGNRLMIYPSKGSIQTVPSYFKDSVVVNIDKQGRALRRNRFYINPEKDSIKIPFISSNKLAKELIKEETQKPLEIIAFDKISGQSRIFKSTPVDSVVKQMLLTSDNFLAEQLMLNSSTVLGDTISFKISRDWLLKNPLKEWQDIRWVDGSGLSRYNLFSPLEMLYLLRQMEKEYTLNRLVYLMPSWDNQGTKMEKHQKDFIYAKSGSMSGVYALVGYVKTNKGKWLRFAYMNNNFVGSNQPVKNRIYSFLKNLHDVR